MRYLVIRTENLSKNYGRTQGLKSITLEVEPGEVYGVLGPKGAGKTTLLNTLMNLVRPTAGVVWVMGMDSVRQTSQVHTQVGYLPGTLNFPASLTAQQVFTRLASLYGAIEGVYLKQLCDRFNLDLQKQVSSMSEAEVQALGIVHAFVRRSELVLLDSPSTNLDAERQSQLYKLIGETRTSGATVVIASESLIEMERICDRVAILHQGKLLAVERGVVLRSRALRHIEMRFAEPVMREAFSVLPNIQDLNLEENKLRCTLQGDPDALFKTASQFRLLDVISQQPSLDEVYRNFYGVWAKN